MDKKTKNEIKSIIENYKLTNKIAYKPELRALVILSSNRRTKEDYANIVNVLGELEELLGRPVEIKDQGKKIIDFDDEVEED